MNQTAPFRPLRRRRQELSYAACAEILERNTSGVLALAGDGGYPYAVPLSYVYVPAGPVASGGDAPLQHDLPCGTPAQQEPPLGRLLFHSAREGHKIDAILRDGRASFCVVDQDRVVPEEFTTYFRSVIAFGRVRVIERDAEKRAAAELLSQRFAPEVPLERHEAEIDRFWQTLTMLELAVEHLSGKEAIELVRGRAQ
ncbi:pyridoxamine 5'-phosphate oxidase family protein [Collinsella sp. An268]|uniref:pyridoxamine 5'-phosphate oxidase family protein n=1 Tax=Collinsella sp. An268 TaxID=1965612 RepID=UPI000B36D616|nr:pyridoxamine 5'-phosphate oxidase family protein [Collinsella sp. An268]OUO64537.1 hypothetical protein B5F70_04720 [Collinsella sp. An268]